MDPFDKLTAMTMDILAVPDTGITERSQELSALLSRNDSRRRELRHNPKLLAPQNQAIWNYCLNSYTIVSNTLACRRQLKQSWDEIRKKTELLRRIEYLQDIHQALKKATPTTPTEKRIRINLMRRITRRIDLAKELVFYNIRTFQFPQSINTADPMRIYIEIIQLAWKEHCEQENKHEPTSQQRRKTAEAVLRNLLPEKELL